MSIVEKIKTLIVAADAMELETLADLGRRRFVVRHNTAYLSAGIGPVAAAFGLTHFLEDHCPDKIIAIGTAGVIDAERFSIGQVVRALSVATVSGFFQLYTPEPQPHRILLSMGRGLALNSSRLRHHGADFILRRDKSGGAKARLRHHNSEPGAAQARPPLFGRLPATAVFAPQEITREAGFREALLRQGYGVEHLESFAFAFTARKFRIPIDIVLGLTNLCGPGAHRQWKTNARAVMEKVGKVMAASVR